MNLNMLYKVDKYRRLGDYHLYLYTMETMWSVIVYDSDDDTIISEYTQCFTKYVDALHYFKEIKEKLLLL